MIPENIEQRLKEQGCNKRTDDSRMIISVLEGLEIDPNSELGEFITTYDPMLVNSKTSDLQLEDALAIGADSGSPVEVDPFETPLGMTTGFVREVWELPEKYACLTSTEGEGGYIYESDSGAIYDFKLAQRDELVNKTLSPRWDSFYEFLNWYLS